MRSTIALAVTAFGLALATPASAGEASAVMRVSATVTQTCSVSAGALDFALDNSPRAEAVAEASVVLRCNGATPYELAMDAGTSGNREMVDPVSGNTLAYEIYSDPGHATRWGNSLGVDTVSGMADASGEAVHTAYGAARTDRRIAAGTYADAVVITVNF